MIALLSFFAILILSLLVVRVASVALTLTGMSEQSARFQARSAWTGTGFTTAESEAIMAHPVRRRIVGLLMVLRSAGLVTAVSALILSFANASDSEVQIRRLLIMIVVLGVLWLVSISRTVDLAMSRIIAAVLRRYTDLEIRDYAGLLHMAEDYRVMELRVESDDWLCGRTLIQLDLPEEGVLVLGITRAGGRYIGAPRGRSVIEDGDTLLLYGRGEVLHDLATRERGWTGEAAHRERAREHEEVLEEQEEKEQEGEAGQRDSETARQGEA